VNVERFGGAAAVFHARPLPEPLEATVWLFAVDEPALVLGSAQPDAVVDRAAAARAGVDVVRRRSGGGAVLVIPGECLWVDVLLPRHDPRWDDDVGTAAHWVGDAWAAAVGDGARTHRGALQRSPWSDLVCFAGLGPGEVTRAGQKVVGISQRRTRAGARFQCAALADWDPASLLALLALSQEDRDRAEADIRGGAAGVGELSTVEAKLLAALGAGG
jgi:lipoate-protein ligase A